ncbi:hypothetical protein OOZ15_17075 [Galbibacter sp. EGI 63066]|uniref:hypothetical protein n=1 Tax=Galbibacter sp. EGI 63066 TaxID=2993559 RepID=UPI0022493D01|nr:hypothetical protein [Galbibacter sp. EGI 63066]MCX2681668.1 hypothetical protein [Galbibacter sp. EGI 63066]
MELIKNLFKPSDKHKGVWPIKVYVLKLFFLLMFLFAAKDAWTELITHKGEWNPEIAIAWCAIAAYTTLSGLGVFHTLKMLPIMLFMFFYKGLWLFFVAYPLWQNEQLVGSEAEDWVPIFMLMIIPVIFTPWIYVFKTYVLGKD